jgi:hypothetical protein
VVVCGICGSYLVPPERWIESAPSVCFKHHANLAGTAKRRGTI